jgi:ribonuclease Y
MEFTFTNIIITLVGVAAGFIISKLLEKTSITKGLENANNEAARILKSAESEGENLKKDVFRIEI